MTSFLFPPGVTNIGNFAFQNCRQLASITINDDNYFDWPNFFQGCTNLTAVNIGGAATNLPNRDFLNWTGLTMISVDSTNAAYSSVDGVLFDKGTNTLLACPDGKGGSYTVPDGVVSIARSAFEGCAGLTGVTIPDSVAGIGDFAFSGCGGLTFIAMGNGVTNIGDSAFYSCFNLTNAVMGNQVARIGMEAFANCYSLTSVIIPGSVSNIDSLAFSSCTNLTGMFFSGNAPVSVDAFAFDGSPVTACYLPETTGWNDFAINAGIPISLWLPQMQTNPGTFGVQTNQYGFNISWACGQTVVIEASTNLLTWQPVQTNTLTTGSAYFSDPHWIHYSGRFYRLRSP